MKKNITIIAIVLMTTVLGFLTVIIALRLRQVKPVAPTVPQTRPQAQVVTTPNPNCVLTVNILATPTPTPTPTPSTTPTPTPSTTPTPTPSSTPTPTPVTGCYKDCSSVSCPSSLSCQDISGSKKCVNPSCPSESDCVCNNLCWSICTSDNSCASGQSCLQTGNDKRCVNPACIQEQDCSCATTTTPTPPTTPQAATIWPTFAVILGGLLFLTLGFVL
ncbi:MAG: hypothetical protein V1858_00545 [Candidatus Gottesmanbacteria bacterium]